MKAPGISNANRHGPSSSPSAVALANRARTQMGEDHRSNLWLHRENAIFGCRKGFRIAGYESVPTMLRAVMRERALNSPRTCAGIRSVTIALRQCVTRYPSLTFRRRLLRFRMRWIGPPPPSTPIGDVRGIQALPPQDQATFTGLRAAIKLLENSQLVLAAKPSTLRGLRRRVWGLSWAEFRCIHDDSPLRPRTVRESGEVSHSYWHIGLSTASCLLRLDRELE